MTRLEALMAGGLVLVLALFLWSQPRQPASANTSMDRQVLKIPSSLVSNSNALITAAGLGQSFQIHPSSNSPTCDLPGTVPHQKARLTCVSVKVLASMSGSQDPPGCRTMYSDLKVSIRATRTGEALAEGYAVYWAPSFQPGGDWAVADFVKEPVLDMDATYYVVVQRTASISPADAISSGTQASWAAPVPLNVSQMSGMNINQRVGRNITRGEFGSLGARMV